MNSSTPAQVAASVAARHAVADLPDTPATTILRLAVERTITGLLAAKDFTTGPEAMHAAAAVLPSINLRKTAVRCRFTCNLTDQGFQIDVTDSAREAVGWDEYEIFEIAGKFEGSGPLPGVVRVAAEAGFDVYETLPELLLVPSLSPEVRIHRFPPVVEPLMMALVPGEMNAAGRPLAAIAGVHEFARLAYVEWGPDRFPQDLSMLVDLAAKVDYRAAVLDTTYTALGDGAVGVVMGALPMKVVAFLRMAGLDLVDDCADALDELGLPGRGRFDGMDLLAAMLQRK